MMPRIADPMTCSGCTACQAACRKGAITMVPDRMGFLYPSVNGDLCVDCGMCEATCEKVRKLEPEYKTRAFAVRHRDIAEVVKSRSGAAFVALSDRILSLGGSIYGAAFDKGWSVRHVKATDRKGRDAFRGSKYIQSRMEGSISNVISDLSEGMWVLFSGTPCQCRAVKASVDRQAGLGEKLILVDIVCHGVPSPRIWNEYLKLIAKGREIVSADFRDKKRFGWKAHKESITFSDGKTESSRSFTDLFYKHIILRPSCENCLDNKPERVSDLTLADFWGWEKIDPEMNRDDMGYSLVLVNSDKGKSLLEDVSGDLHIKEVNVSDCLQRPLVEPVSLDSRSGELAECLENEGMEAVLRKYGDWNYSHRLRYFKNTVRQQIRKLLGRK